MLKISIRKIIDDFCILLAIWRESVYIILGIVYGEKYAYLCIVHTKTTEKMRCKAAFHKAV